MQLRYDEDLVEAAVFVRASGTGRGIPRLQLARFHREREKLYAILDPDARNTAFFKLHLDWFREWGLGAGMSVHTIHESRCGQPNRSRARPSRSALVAS